jgi:hypothetical protein
MYRIRRGDAVIGQTRLEQAEPLTGQVQGTFDPAGDFELVRGRIPGIADAIDAELEAEVQAGRIPADWVGDYREMQLLGDERHRAVWADLEVVDADGRVVNARVDGFAESNQGVWLIGVTINDERYWRSVADSTL